MALATASDGTISLRCVVSSPDPGPDPGGDYSPFTAKAAYFETFRAFEFPVQISAPIPESCFGDPDSALGTGACSAASAAGLSLTTDSVAISVPLSGNQLNTLGSFTAKWQFDVSAGPLSVEYQVLGIGGSCPLTVQGANTTVQVDFVFDRLDAAQDVIRVDTVRALDLGALSFSGCGAVSDIANLLLGLQDAIRGQIAQMVLDAVDTPVCRARDSITFQACSIP